MLQSDSTMLVVGEGINAPQRTPCCTSLFPYWNWCLSVRNGKFIKFDDVTQGSHALSVDGGSDCISATYKFIQFVFNRFYDYHTYFDLLNVSFWCWLWNYNDAGSAVRMWKPSRLRIVKWYWQFAQAYVEMLLIASIFWLLLMCSLECKGIILRNWIIFSPYFFYQCIV